MLVLSYGIPKSGSTLAFQLARSSAIQAGFAQPPLPPEIGVSGEDVNFTDNVSVDNIRRMVDFAGDKGLLIVKTHSRLGVNSWALVDDLSARGLIRVHTVYRDPREICLSLCDAGRVAREKNYKAFSEFTNVDSTVEAVQRQLQTFRTWSGITNALVMYYDDFAFDTEAALARMAANLGVPVSADDVIAEATQRRFTQKNKAVPKRYLTDMTPEELARLSVLFAPFIQKACNERDMSWVCKRLRVTA